MRAGQGQASPVLSHFTASEVVERQPYLNRAQQTSSSRCLRLSTAFKPSRASRAWANRQPLRYPGRGRVGGLCRRGIRPEFAGRAAASRCWYFCHDGTGISRASWTGAAAGDSTAKHFYMLDESSLGSTKQVREFLHKIGPQNMVLLVGDIRQHQAVEAGKSFQQLQQSRMRTAQLDQIVRQKDSELLKVVEHLSKADVVTGIRMLQEQSRVTYRRPSTG